MWKVFLNKDFSKVITKVHKLVRKKHQAVDKNKVYENKTPKLENKTITHSMDFKDVISLYSVGGMANIRKPLFYSDYPYEGSTGYSVRNWYGTDSRALIDKLVSSGGKFIFSCRACATIEANSNTSLKQIKSINKGIYDDVLDYFKNKGIPLWVARFSTNKKSFIDALKDNDTTEVMITNYEIQHFKCKSEGVVETMSYKLFMKDIDKYLIR